MRLVAFRKRLLLYIQRGEEFYELPEMRKSDARGILVYKQGRRVQLCEHRARRIWKRQKRRRFCGDHAVKAKPPRADTGEYLRRLPHGGFWLLSFS